jgi:hypothetical protein
LHDDEGYGAGSELVSNGSGCGSGRPKNIRIRIPKTAGNKPFLLGKELKNCCILQTIEEV